MYDSAAAARAVRALRGHLTASALTGACSVPLGIRFREIPISGIELPAQAPRGEPVSPTATCRNTPAGTLKLVAEVDQTARTVELTALEYEFQTLVPRIYPQMVVAQKVQTEIVPLLPGQYDVTAHGSTASARFQVSE